MIPAANDIVNSLLVREGVDDPERYVSWLKKQASARTLRDTGFGAAISTSDDDMIQLNAQELGIDIENPVTVKETLERDLAIIEANGMAILRRMGLFLQDEGHGIDGDRITSAWISVDNEDQARELAAKVLSLARDQNNDPARTGSGTLNNLMPEAARLIWQNVSELGQSLIDVAIYFFDTEKLAEWASMAHVEEALDPDAPEAYLNRTFSVDEILRDYERTPQGWTKIFRRPWPGVDMEIDVKRRGHTIEDNADTRYDIDILKGLGDGTGNMVHLETFYAIKLIELREAVQAAEKAVVDGGWNRLRKWSLLTVLNRRPGVQEAAPQPPPEDDPETVLKVHQHSLFRPELERLGFEIGNDNKTVRFFDEEVPRWWVKGYTAADGSQRAVYIFIVHVLSGGNEFRINNLDAANKCWYKHDIDSEVNVHCQTTAQSGAAVRDIDAAMRRSAEMSLSLEEEHAMLQRVATHYSKWYWDAMQPPDQPVFNINPHQG